VQVSSTNRAAWLGFFGSQFFGSSPDVFGTLTLKDVTYRDGTVAPPGHFATGKRVESFLHNVDSATLIVEEFGKKNGRRHFHFVSKQSIYLDNQLGIWAKDLGFIKVERMQSALACLGYITKYMTKEMDNETARFWINWKGI
jgi:hypothetical protein